MFEETVDYDAARAAHERMLAARAEYEDACAERAREFLRLNLAGESMRRIAGELGMSYTAVLDIIALGRRHAA